MPCKNWSWVSRLATLTSQTHTETHARTHTQYRTILVVYLFTDTKKMPLGKLSKSQIAKGFEVATCDVHMMLIVLTGAGGD